MLGSRALFCIFLLTVTALAGCAAPGADGDTPGEDEGWEGEGGGRGADGSLSKESEDLSPEEKLQAALDALSTSASPAKFHLRAFIQEQRRDVTHDLFVDRAASTSFYVTNATDADPILFGQIGRTFLGGDPHTHLVVARDETAAPFTSPQQLYHDHVNEHGAIGAGLYLDVEAILLQGGYFGHFLGGETSVTDTTHEGKAAKRIVASGIGESTWIMDADLKQVLWGEIVQSSSDGSTRTATFTFRYGADATHPAQGPLARAATLAFQDPESLGEDRLSGDSSRTWTVRASESDQKLSLAEVELRLYGASGASDPAQFTLPLTQGMGENANAKLTFVDVDGDGSVSAGDTITLEVLNAHHNLQNYHVGLFDAQSEYLLLNR